MRRNPQFPFSPISRDQALQLYDEGKQIYLVRTSLRPTIVTERVEIERGSDVFQIATAELELEKSREESLLQSSEKQFGIYQITERDPEHDYRFMGLDYVQKKGINIDDYKKQLEDLNGKSVEDQFYGLKTQYIYPLIEKENIIYIPSPYLVINAVTESMLNRVTFGDEQLRREFGKEVIESYLYDIASQVKTVSWISKEIVYNVGHQEIRSPDVLVGEGEKMTFYDTKAFSPSLRLRSLDRTEIENDIARYAKNVIQLYKQIVNYLAGKFELDKHYEKKDIFGVVVVLEDAVVSRKKVYDKVFLELERTAHLDDEEKRYIHSHIKVLPLREVETFMLQNMSPLPFLVEQVENENQWDNYRYGCPQKENGLIAEYESYVKKLKSMLIARIRTV